MKRKDLSTYPERPWNTITEYRALYIAPSGKKHDSGWHLMTIVGVNDNGSLEIASYCDDIVWKGKIDNLRTDMCFPSGIIHMWGNGIGFTVGHGLSSTDILVSKRNTVNAPNNI